MVNLLSIMLDKCVLCITFDTDMRFQKFLGEKISTVPLCPTSSVHQTKLTGEKNYQQPPKDAGIQNQQ
jgi:hypothetical protein